MEVSVAWVVVGLKVDLGAEDLVAVDLAAEGLEEDSAVVGSEVDSEVVVRAVKGLEAEKTAAEGLEEDLGAVDLAAGGLEGD